MWCISTLLIFFKIRLFHGRWTQTENYLQSLTPSTPALRLSSLYANNTLRIYNICIGDKYKKANSSLLLGLSSIKSQKQGRGTIIISTVFSAGHSDTLSNGYSNNSNWHTNPIGKVRFMFGRNVESSACTWDLLNQNLYFNKIPRWFVCTLNYEKY